MTAVLEKNAYGAVFDKTEKSFVGAELTWLARLRREALERFAQTGFPTEQDEAWRFTKVDAIALGNFEPLPSLGKGCVKEVPKLFDSYRLVFIDGHFSPDLSAAPSVPGLFLGSLSQALESKKEFLEPSLRNFDGAFSSLNAAFFTDGALIHLAKGVVLDKPIQLIFISGGAKPSVMSPTRVIVAAEKGASASIIEYFYGVIPKIHFANAVTDITLGEDASINHYKIQGENEEAFHIGTTRVRQGRNSRYFSHSTTLGGALVRNNIHVSLEAEGADCTLNGLYLAKGRQHIDNHTFIDHAAPHGTSRELYKGILDDSARAVFSGTIQVQPAAQKTNAMVYNRNLLLSEQGLVHTKPEFKIHANDVQCKHGATIGQLSQDALFYLRSRGLGEAQARRLLIHAFAGEMLASVALEPLREILDDLLSARLPDSERN